MQYNTNQPTNQSYSEVVLVRALGLKEFKVV